MLENELRHTNQILKTVLESIQQAGGRQGRLQDGSEM